MVMRQAVLFSIVVALFAGHGTARADLRPWHVGTNQSALVSKGVVVQAGEIVVMQGDGEIVTDLGGGELSISSENLTSIIQRFYQWYPDEFDAIVVTTTFPDPTNPGAYAICGEARVQGLGMPGFGCPGGSSRLLSVTNMNSTMTWGGDSWLGVMGQEFGHSWLVSWMFNDPATQLPSDELLGRDGSHYASWVNAEGSYMDGHEWKDNGDGTFTAVGYMTRFSSLDLYGMGIVPASDVSPFFIIRGATHLDGTPLTAAEQVPKNTTVMGTRVDVTIDDIMAASGGPRLPAWDDEPEEFRMAFVLVTPPGTTAAQVATDVEILDGRRLDWEERFATDTANRGFVCTDVTARCPRAAARVVSVSIKEKDAAGNGVLEPGEDLLAVVELWNTGGADADTAVGELRAELAEGFQFEEPAVLPVIPVNEKRTVEIPFRITGDACGQELQLTAVATIEQRHWKASTQIRPGIQEGAMESFATPGQWKAVNPEDTATTGRWQHGVPGPLYFAGRLLQPEGGRAGKTDPAWFTSIEGRWDTSELAGGATYLTSDPIDMSSTLRPTLVFHVWYLALDRAQSALTPADEAHLVVQVSSDDGQSWTDILAVSGGPYRWERFEAPVPEEVELTETMRYRFKAVDDAAADGRLVEIGIDDVQLNGHVATCKSDEGGCGCRVAGREENRGLPVLVVAALGAFILRRRSAPSARR